MPDPGAAAPRRCGAADRRSGGDAGKEPAMENRGSTRLPAPEALRSVAEGLVTLPEAFLTLARSQEELTRAAADLQEREVWALTVLLGASEPIWPYVNPSTLAFSLPQSTAGVHLEV